MVTSHKRLIGAGAFVLVVCGILSFSLSAADYMATWTGAVDNNFYNKGNWDQVPRESNCTLRFTNSVSLAYNTNIAAEDAIAYAGNAYPHGSKWLLAAEGITVVFGKTSNQYITGNVPTIDVAKDSMLVISNNLSPWNSPKQFYKKGAGTFRMHGQLFTNSGTIERLNVEAGKMEFMRPGSENRVGFGFSTICVSSGAELALVSRMTSVKTSLAIDVATNAIVRFTQVKTYQEEPLEISCISGAGEVIASDGGTSELKFNLDRQSAMGPFTGRMHGDMILDFLAKNNADDAQRFVLYRADGLDGIRVRNGGAVVPVKGLADATYYADGYNGSDIFRLEDAEGNPADRAINVVNPASLVIKGTGKLTLKRQWNGGSFSIYQPKVTFAGKLVYAGDATLTLGDGTAANGFDLTSSGNLTGIEIASGATVALQGNCGEADAVHVDIPITGGGSLYNQNTHYVLSDFNMRGDVFRSWNKTRFTGGTATLKTLESGQSTSHEITIAGAHIMAGESIGSYSRSPLPTPTGVAMVGNKGGFNVGVDAGELAYGAGSGWHTMTLRGGRLWWTAGVWNGDVSSVVFDGGELAADLKDQYYQYHIARKTSGITNYVGTAGGRVVVLNGGLNAGLYYNPYTRSLPGVTSGEFSFYGDAFWHFCTHFDLNGPIHFRDGVLRVKASQYLSASDKSLFGDGETRFTDADFYFASEDWASGAPAVDFKALAYDGVLGVRLDKAATITARALRRLNKGAMIFIGAASVGTSSGGTSFKVTGGVGAYQHPVVCCESGQYRFTRYDAEAGFVSVADDECETDCTKATADKYLVIGNSVTIANDTMVRARGAKHVCGYNVNTTLGSGSVLRLGDDVNPALFLFGMKSRLGGAGSLDFGSSEGIVGVAFAENVTPVADKQCELNCNEIRGSEGVAYLGWGAQNSLNRRVSIAAHGKYSGETSIAGCEVVPRVADAFSTGRIVIKPGERHGGRMRIYDELTLTNDFTVGGTGSGNGNNYGEFDGAICFHANATLRGNVAITEPARMAAYGGMRGTLAGDVSGGRLEVYTAKTDTGTVALTGNNTHTGGTEVIYATLAVDSADALGSGEVALASGTLRFENNSPITVANELRGFGTLALTGANVHFTGLRPRLGAVKLDIPNAEVTLSEIPSFVTGITNSLSRKSILHLTGDNAFAIDPAAFAGKFELVLEGASTLDLGGKALTLRRFTGNRDAVNGTIVETCPRRGLAFLVF